MAEEQEKLQALLARLEKSLRKRALVATERSPETLLDELEALELFIDLRKKL